MTERDSCPKWCAVDHEAHPPLFDADNWHDSAPVIVPVITAAPRSELGVEGSQIDLTINRRVGSPHEFVTMTLDGSAAAAFEMTPESAAQLARAIQDALKAWTE